METNCKTCGKVVDRKPSEIKRRANIFCSRSCAATHNNKTNPKRHVQGQCAECKKSITTRTKFCSVICRYKTSSTKSRAERTKWMQEFRLERKIKAVALKGGACTGCGYNKSIRALHFHHLDPTEKDFGLSRFDGKWEKVLKELEKCLLVCANCHAEIHDDIANGRA